MTSTLEYRATRPFATRHPLTVFLTIVLSIGLPSLTLASAFGIAPEPFVLLTAYIGLAGAALVLTRWVDGPSAQRQLLRRLWQWRFGATRWLIAVVAMPLSTITVAAASGTLQAPARGWAYEIGTYLFAVFVFGALILNLWEELGWAGFVQARLMQRHRPLVAALLTAIPFIMLHVPLAFSSGWTWSTAAVTVGTIIIAAPFFRYLVGMVYLDTAGSLLAVGVLHAAFNASGSLSVVSGGWQYIPAMIVLTLLTALLRWWKRPHAAGSVNGRIRP